MKVLMLALVGLGVDSGSEAGKRERDPDPTCHQSRCAVVVAYDAASQPRARLRPDHNNTTDTFFQVSCIPVIDGERDAFLLIIPAPIKTQVVRTL